MKTLESKAAAYALLLLCSCAGSGKSSMDNADAAAGAMSAAMPGADATGEMLEAADYVRWMKDPDNGFRNEKTIDNLRFSVQYKTPEYITCMEQHGRACSDALVRKNTAELSGMQYYDLRIVLNDGGNELLKYNLSSAEQYNERVNYFAFGMQHDIQLIDGHDTLPCLLYHFERAYDVTPSATLVLGFLQKQPEGDKTLLVDDRTFNKGLLKFRFSAAELNNKPKLKTL